MTTTFRTMGCGAAVAAIALVLAGCPRGLCSGGDCGDGDSGVEATDGCVRVGGTCGALTCCATDKAGNALSCEAEADAGAGSCRTSCGQPLAACGPGAPCCAGTFSGHSLECAQGACAQCLGAGAPCGLDDTPCCSG